MKIIQAEGAAFTLISAAARWQGFAGPRGYFGTNGHRGERSGSVRFHEMAAAVLLPAGFIALHAEGLFLAEADGAEAVGRDAK